MRALNSQQQIYQAVADNNTDEVIRLLNEQRSWWFKSRVDQLYRDVFPMDDARAREPESYTGYFRWAGPDFFGPIHKAVSAGNGPMIDALLAFDPKLIYSLTSAHDYPLAVAIRKDQSGVLPRLLSALPCVYLDEYDRRCQFDLRAFAGTIEHAALNKQWAVIDIIAESLIPAVGKKRPLPEDFIAAIGDEDRLTRLLHFSLKLAAAHGQTELAKKLILAGAKRLLPIPGHSTSAYENNNLAHLAAKNGHLATLKELVKDQIELLFQLNTDSLTPLEILAAKGEWATVFEYLRLEAAQRLDGFQSAYNAILSFAAKTRGGVGVVRELLSIEPAATEAIKGANNRAAYEAMALALSASADYENFDALVAYSPLYFFNKNSDGKTPLEVAAFYGQWAVVDRYLSPEYLNERIKAHPEFQAVYGRVLRSALLGRGLSTVVALTHAGVRSIPAFKDFLLDMGTLTFRTRDLDLSIFHSVRDAYLGVEAQSAPDFQSVYGKLLADAYRLNKLELVQHLTYEGVYSNEVIKAVVLKGDLNTLRLMLRVHRTRFFTQLFKVVYGTAVESDLSRDLNNKIYELLFNPETALKDLHACIVAGEFEGVQFILSRDPKFLMTNYGAGFNALERAGYVKNWHCVLVMLRFLTKAETHDTALAYGRVLQAALFDGQILIARALVENGAIVNSVEEFNWVLKSPKIERDAGIQLISWLFDEANAFDRDQLRALRDQAFLTNPHLFMAIIGDDKYLEVSVRFDSISEKLGDLLIEKYSAVLPDVLNPETSLHKFFSRHPVVFEQLRTAAVAIEAKITAVNAEVAALNAKVPAEKVEVAAPKTVITGRTGPGLFVPASGGLSLNAAPAAAAAGAGAGAGEVVAPRAIADAIMSRPK